MTTWKYQVLIPLRIKGVYTLLILLLEACGVSFLTYSWAETIDLQSTQFSRAAGESIKPAIKTAGCSMINGIITNCEIVSTVIFNTDTADVRADFEVTFKELCGKVWGKKICVPPLTLVKTAKAYFTYNLQTKTYGGQFQFTFPSLKAEGKKWGIPYSFTYTPPPYKISLDTIKSLVEGKLSLEEIAELIPNPLPNLFRVEPSNDYQKVKEAYTARWGEANVYFASKDFVKWAAPENRIPEWGAELILTGGAASEHIMEQVKGKLKEQWDAIQAWLKRKTGLQAGALLEMIFSGKRFTWPYLAAVFQPVQYRQQYYFFGKHISKFDRSQNHAAFVLIWQWGNPQTVDDFVTARIKELERGIEDELCQQLEGTVSCDEISKGFALHGVDYARQLFSEIATNLYREVYGSNAIPTEVEIAEITNDLANGLSYAEVRAKVKATRLAILRKERAIQFLLSSYMMTHHKQ